MSTVEPGSGVVDGVGRSLSRRSFLKLGGAGLASVAFGGVLASCGGASGSSGGSGGGGDTYNFRLAETQAEGHPTTRGDKKFAQLVKDRSNGRITIEVFPNSQLGEEAATIEQVQAGSIEFVRSNAAPMAEFVESLGVFGLPYIFDSSEHLWKFLNGDGGNTLLQDMNSAGFKGLAYYDSGSRNFYTRDGDPVRGVDDVKGLKIRVQKSDINVALIKALGGSATPMDFGEVYSALQSGTIDGAENNWPSYLSTSHYEVAPEFTLDAHQRLPEVLFMNQDTWNQLNDKDKDIIQGSARDSVDYQRKVWDTSVKEAQDKIGGMKSVDIIQVNDLDPWKEATRSVIQNHRSDFKKSLDQVEATR